MAAGSLTVVTTPSTPHIHDDIRTTLKALYTYRQQFLTGDEKGEAQIFCDRLLRAFGHHGIKEAGATLEMRIKKRDAKGTAFADLMWKPRCLVEMKKAGVDLSKHRKQAFDYWVDAVPNRPKYVILCNFDEFWIYDFNIQLDEPVDRVTLDDLADRATALAFMLPEPAEPIFRNNLVGVTREAAAQAAKVFRSMVERGVERDHAQRFVLQSVMAMFSEDIALLPDKFFTRALTDAKSGTDCYDLLGGLFREMNTPGNTPGGRYAGTPYFNGGLFSEVHPLELTSEEVDLLKQAAATNWTKVRPEVFGTLFEGSMDKGERHASGAHFTSPLDIAKIVEPTIVAPWRQRIDEANTIPALDQVLAGMFQFRVLDPACGSGNFLYVAYREMRRLEQEAIAKISDRRRSSGLAAQEQLAYVTPDHFFGIDINPFAVEVAKVTMMLAKKLAMDESGERQQVLPLDNLDHVIVAKDALFNAWPPADAIIGNPPFMGRRKMQAELGAEYTSRLDSAYPNRGVSDFVTYWFPLAHDHLPAGGRAGLVATDTVRENQSRQVSLDYVVDNGGTIIEAVSSEPWSGEANVHVSIINWVKGDAPGTKVLWLNNNQLKLETDHINSSLTADVDVSKAAKLECNKTPQVCFQGQTYGVAAAFLIDDVTAQDLRAHGEGAVVHPFMGGSELLTKPAPNQFIIDIPEDDLVLARARYPRAMKRLEARALPARKTAAANEEQANLPLLQANPKARVNRHHDNFLKHWWKLDYRREALLNAVDGMSRVLAVPRYQTQARQTVVVFVDPQVHMSDQTQVFTLDDDYSFGIMSSSIHRDWLELRCSTMGMALRYTSTTVWDSFPWPQNPSAEQVGGVREAAAKVLAVRGGLIDAGISLESQYNALREPGYSELGAAHRALDEAVFTAYGFDPATSVAAQTLALNQSLAASDPGEVRGPGSSEGWPAWEESGYRVAAV
jgi:SAM-dependent methyltransferase